MNTAYPAARARACTPLQIDAKYGFSRSGTTRPMLPVRPVISPRAAGLGR